MERVAKTVATADSFMERVASLMERVSAAEAEAVWAVQQKERTASMFQELHDKYVELNGDYQRAIHTVDKLDAMVDKKESELQKVMDLNVRLSHVVDMKEAQLLAMSQQCKALALNSD